MRRKYDSNDAVMAHQGACNRLSTSSNEQLMEEYLSVCREHADSLEARNTQQRFQQQVDAMKTLLTTQRPHSGSASKGAGPSSAAAASGTSATAYPRTQFSIIPNDWGKEHYKKLVFSWNVKSKELMLTSTEAIVAWLLQNTEYEHFEALVKVSDATCYSKVHGLCFQKWPNLKDAKNYVNALHLALNAPLGRFAVPFAFCIEILGYPVVAKSLAPVERPWHTWRSNPLCVFHMDAMCASVRLFFHAFARNGPGVGDGAPNGRRANNAEDDDNNEDDDDEKDDQTILVRQAQATANSAALSATIHLVDVPSMELVVSIGTDTRWYILDARSLANRQPHGRHTQLSLRVPRRETLFAFGGVISTPYSPNEFILRFKLKIIAEQLLTDPSFAQGVNGLISTIMHMHGVRFGPFVYALYLYVCEQERQFKTSVHAANRRNAMTPAAVAKLQRFQHVKQVIVSELLARIVKELVREELLRVQQSKAFVTLMLQAVSDSLDDDAETEKIVASLNNLLLDAVNLVLGSMFNAEGAASSPARSGGQSQWSTNGPLGIAPSSISGSPAGGLSSDASPDRGGSSARGGGGGGGPLANKFHQVMLEGLFFEDMVFMLNDRFVNRIYAVNELVTECKVLGVPFAAKFEVNIDDVDVTRVLVCIEALLGSSIVVRNQKIAVDPQRNFIEQFFNLDDNDINPLRTDAVLTSIDLPLCLISGVRSKVLDFANLQQRVAAKLASMIDSTMMADVLHYNVSVVKFILLHANDVTIAHRGYLQEEDYEDVWGIHQQVSCPPTVYGNNMMSAFDAAVALRAATLMSSTDLQLCLRRLMKFTEATRSLYDSAVGTAFVLADKVTIICKVCEKFVASGLVSALETALTDLASLTEDAYPHQRIEGQQQRQLRKATKHAEIKSIQSAHFHLLALSLLVRHVMLPDVKRTQGESLAAAVRYCTKRRDLIVDVYGEKSIEAGIACNDIAAICSNNKFDFDRAEEEFERAVFILTEVQPDGASLQVTKNNLAFLCFRKAERLRKQIHFDAAQKGPAARAAINNEVQTLLAKAKMLLTEVMDFEQKLPVLDFAAALNNLASIKLFEGQYEEAKSLFTRTLELTGRLGDGDESLNKAELPCRVHAVRNLKVLARRQYLSAVMRVQAAVRRFVTKIRERKNFAMLRAIKPIQRLGRAFVIRMFLAKHYRFSAFHTWLRKPRVFTRKLDPTFRSMPLEARTVAWHSKLSKAARLLQRCGRGKSARVCVGQLVCFQRAHFERRRPLVLQEMSKRRVGLFGAQVLRWKLLYGCECIAAFCVMYQDRIAKTEVRIVRAGVHNEEAQAFRGLFLRSEADRRAAISATWMATLWHTVAATMASMVDNEWLHSRGLAMQGGLCTLEADNRGALATLEASMRISQLDACEAHLRLFHLEENLRECIAVEAFTKFVAPNVVSVLQNHARAYLTRKRCGRIRFLPEHEVDLRRRIDREEFVSLNRSAIVRHVNVLRVMEAETRARASLQAEALAVFDKHPGRLKSGVTVAYLELLDRTAWMQKEIEAFQASIIVREGRERVDLQCMEGYLCLLAREALVRMARTELFSQQWCEMLRRLYLQETGLLLKAYTEFALAMTLKKEELDRYDIRYLGESQSWLEKVAQPFEEEALRIAEQRAWANVLQLASASLTASQVCAVTRARHQEQQAELVQRETSQRQNYVAPLEAVARGYIVADWQRFVGSAFYARCKQYEAKLLLEWFEHDHVYHARRLVEAKLFCEHRAMAQQVTTLMDVGHARVCRIERLLAQERAERGALAGVALQLAYLPLQATWAKLGELQTARLCPLYGDIMQLHVVATEDVERRTEVLPTLLDMFSGVVADACEALIVDTVDAQRRRERDALAQTELLHREDAARRTLEADIGAWWSCIAAPNKAHFLSRVALIREEATAAAALYFLEKHSNIAASVLLPRVAQFLEKKWLEVQLLNAQRLQRRAVLLAQRVGRGFLRRRRVGRFHFDEVVVPVLLMQRVARGYLHRSCDPTLVCGTQTLRFEAIETLQRERLGKEEVDDAAVLQRFVTSFTGTRYLRMKASTAAVRAEPGGTAAAGRLDPSDCFMRPHEPTSTPPNHAAFARTAPRPCHGQYGTTTTPGGPRPSRGASAPAQRPESAGGNNNNKHVQRPPPSAAPTPHQQPWRSTRLFATPVWQSSALYRVKTGGGGGVSSTPLATAQDSGTVPLDSQPSTPVHEPLPHLPLGSHGEAHRNGGGDDVLGNSANNSSSQDHHQSHRTIDSNDASVGLESLPNRPMSATSPARATSSTQRRGKGGNHHRRGHHDAQQRQGRHPRQEHAVPPVAASNTAMHFNNNVSPPVTPRVGGLVAAMNVYGGGGAGGVATGAGAGATAASGRRQYSAPSKRSARR